ncbi:PIR Superfamily Protein [Plasmodium ovale curtisi]|uniref:PIR Superfamily Protein n=1 Tax=Plasmodium ovale curtisi TaxID=864141 RepID=A0A1A8VMQ6_PLAOA|nr:PIR Superfamily Protein [Plasmodium ovale curtisi]
MKVIRIMMFPILVKKFMNYLTVLKGEHNKQNTAGGCKYLYYWIYYILTDKKKPPKYISAFYEKLLENYSSYEEDICKSYKESISEVIYENLNKLNDLYDKFYEIEL